MPELSERLRNVSEFVRRGSVVADIGTDHAYLPVYLIRNNIAERALACDLRKGPLCNAEKAVKSYGLSDKIELRLSDGLDKINPDEAEDIIFCGMGGTLIVRILERAEWVKNKKYRLIFQPQSHSEDVRQYLSENGFEIILEKACKDTGRVYNIFAAEYTGNTEEKSECFIYFGNHIYRNNELDNAVTAKALKLLKTRYEAEKNYGTEEEAEKLKKIIDRAEEIINETHG